VNEDVVLVPEVEVRRSLGARPIRLRVLAPYGAWIGSGKLRVLRLKMNDGEVELVAGYESYRR
jgi:hypothetical protein